MAKPMNEQWLIDMLAALGMPNPNAGEITQLSTGGRHDLPIQDSPGAELFSRDVVNKRGEYAGRIDAENFSQAEQGAADTLRNLQEQRGLRGTGVSDMRSALQMAEKKKEAQRMALIERMANSSDPNLQQRAKMLFDMDMKRREQDTSEKMIAERGASEQLTAEARMKSAEAEGKRYEALLRSYANNANGNWEKFKHQFLSGIIKGDVLIGDLIAKSGLKEGQFFARMQQATPAEWELLMGGLIDNKTGMSTSQIDSLAQNEPSAG